jgi:hypothetical protein
MKKRVLALICTVAMMCTMIIPAKASVVVIREEPNKLFPHSRIATIDDAIAILRHVVGLPSDITQGNFNSLSPNIPRTIVVGDAIFILRGLVGLEEQTFLTDWKIPDDIYFCLSVCSSREGGGCNCYDGLTRGDFPLCHNDMLCLFYEDIWRCCVFGGSIEITGRHHSSGYSWGSWMHVRYRTWQNMQPVE